MENLASQALKMIGDFYQKNKEDAFGTSKNGMDVLEHYSKYLSAHPEKTPGIFMGDVQPISYAAHLANGFVPKLEDLQKAYTTGDSHTAKLITDAMRLQDSPNNLLNGDAYYAQQSVIGNSSLAKSIANKVNNGVITADEAIKQAGDNIGLLQQISRRINKQGLLADFEEAVANENSPRIVDIAKKIIARGPKDPNMQGISVQTLLDYIQRYGK